MPTFDFLLPVGISFYTFQALSYTIDVYRQDVKVEKKFGKVCFICIIFSTIIIRSYSKNQKTLYIKLMRDIILIIIG
jgi:hypothetical protein